MHVFYSPNYYADIGDCHIFPIRKFELVKDRLLLDGTLSQDEIVEPEPAALEDVKLVHTDDYVSRLCTGQLTAREIRRLGLPWSQSLVRRSFYAVGGTISAATTALEVGWGSNLAGGTHHSFPDHGEGFCVLNDVAIAIRALRKRGVIRRAAIVDCDVHQGNGTAAIFSEDLETFTFSIHGANNYPLFKTRSTLDIELVDRTDDDGYLKCLATSLSALFDWNPDIVFYLAGADPYVNDKLGRLAVSIEGLRKRDQHVLNECFLREVPVATVMSGGYGKDINDTVEIHCNTIRTIKQIFELPHAVRATAQTL
ncbi:MAG TPA: histone deacetylase [Pyrinomonadaceae bacterium]|nr:histone deacetylase [Pyrinomonadaceae bacterium]